MRDVMPGVNAGAHRPENFLNSVAATARLCDASWVLRLIIVHNHFRPGGVRRVIELGTPPIVEALRASGSRLEIGLAGGERPDPLWLDQFVRLTAPTPVTCHIETRAGYWAGHQWKRDATVRRLEAFMSRLVDPTTPRDTVFWAHNQGLGRNLALTEALVRTAARTGARLILHHHDWWFDNRWDRWPEMRRAGYASVSTVARTLFRAEPGTVHIAINQVDYDLLERHLPGQAAWLPNPAEGPSRRPAAHVEHARQWLAHCLGEPAPVWLMPVRLLRRKNVAEALLLTRWLRPEAWLVLTGAASSPEEEPYAHRLEAAATRHGWKLKLGVLRRERGAPDVDALIRASEAILLTSLQEGFGLPYLEAAAAGRPLIARMLPNMAPDLSHFGFSFPHGYPELRVDCGLFDWAEECRRQWRLFNAWRERIPRAQRDWVSLPTLLASEQPPTAVPFSRLTLTAQLEVLAAPLAESWSRCAPLNPFVRRWRRLAGQGRLRPMRWPRNANTFLSRSNYGRTFRALLDLKAGPPAGSMASQQAQEDFMRERLRTENLYPLVFADRT